LGSNTWRRKKRGKENGNIWNHRPHTREKRKGRRRGKGKDNEFKFPASKKRERKRERVRNKNGMTKGISITLTGNRDRK